MADELLLPELIRMKQDQLSPGQRRVARFCLADPERAARISAARIGAEVGVSESTVVRLALRLGLDGFPELQQALAQAHHPPRSEQIAAEEAVSKAEESIRLDAENLTQLTEHFDWATVDAAVDAIASAQRVHVIGFRTSFSLAFLASFLLRQIHPDARLVTDMGGGLVEDVSRLTEGDVVLGFSFPRYVRSTARTLEFARGRGAKTIAVTDSVLSPVGGADLVFTVRHDGAGFFNSNVAATALINAVVCGVADRLGWSDPNRNERLLSLYYTDTPHVGLDVPGD